MDGVIQADRATVFEYYSSMNATIENNSQADLVFSLVESTFVDTINYIEIEGDYTGTVMFEYSIDGGETYVSFQEDQMLQVSTNSLVVKIDMEAGATLGNIAVFTK